MGKVEINRLECSLQVYRFGLLSFMGRFASKYFPVEMFMM